MKTFGLCQLLILLMLFSTISRAEPPAFYSKIDWNDNDANESTEASLSIETQIGPGNPTVYSKTTTSQKSAEIVIISGKAAEAFFDRQNKPNFSRPPNPPLQIELYDENGIFGGLTEVSPGTHIFVTARHVLQEVPINFVLETMSQVLGQTEDVVGIEFSENDKPQDLVLLAPRAEAEGLLASNFEKLRSIYLNPSLSDRYYSYQFGSVGRMATRQFSEGVFNRFNESGDAILEIRDGNLTSPGSSGSVVFVAPANAQGDDAWYPAAVVSCLLRKHVAVRGKQSGHVQYPPEYIGVQTISFQSIWQKWLGSARIVSLNELGRQKRQKRTGCDLIDRRGAGGF